MDRNSLFRWILIAGIVVGGYWWFFNRKANDHAQFVPPETYADAPDFAPDVLDVQPGKPLPGPPSQGEICSIRGNRFDARALHARRGPHALLSDRPELRRPEVARRVDDAGHRALAQPPDALSRPDAGPARR